jgi:hypothetical protein
MKIQIEFAAEDEIKLGCFTNIYVLVDGKRVARLPALGYERGWIALVPEYTVTSSRDYETITVEFNGVREVQRFELTS